MHPGIVYVDSRVGSKELAHLFSKRHGLRVSLGHLDSADFAFLGDGGRTYGIERKTLGDLVGSLIKGRLFEHQIYGLMEDYDYVWLAVEGLWRPGDDDAIEIPIGGRWAASRQAVTYSQLSAWLVRWDVIGGGKLRRWRTSSPIETVAFIASIYGWAQKKWKSHEWGPIQKMSPAIQRMAVPEKAWLRRPTQLERTAASLPEIGSKGARKVGKHFASIFDMMTAEEEQWQQAGIGKADARTVCSAIRKRYR